MNKRLWLTGVIVCSLLYITIKINGKYRELPLKQHQVISKALQYEGIPYKAGGTTSKGMDCSGLVQTSFKNIAIKLPRSSKAMSTEGEKVSIDEVVVGDLLFFNIDRLQGSINHVGLVTSVNDNSVKFIHSTTKKGVIISSMNETYWSDAFVKAKRILLSE